MSTLQTASKPTAGAAGSYLQPFLDGSVKFGIVGQGYVGLPLAEAFAAAGVHVLGFDVSAEKVALVNKGESYIGDVPTDSLSKLVKAGLIEATTDFSRLTECEAISICVPTPLSKSKDPDMSYIESAVGQIVKFLRPGQLIVLESTTYPGTTEEFVLPLLENTGMKVGKDFFLSFSPERVDPGNPKYNVKNTPKVVGGVTPECTRRTVELYGHALESVFEVSSPSAAEMVKLLENTFRAVNIAFVNELSMWCRRLDVDVWEVIEAAKTKPFGFMPFYPGPGLGGHCIPIDPLYLRWKLHHLDYKAQFIDLADSINARMPEYVVEEIMDQLNDVAKPLRGSSILVLGMAYKENIEDMRESPAIDVAHILMEKGANVSYHDPHVPDCDIEGTLLSGVALSADALRAADLVVIATAHDEVDYELVAREAKLIFDTKNVLVKKGVSFDEARVRRI